MGRTITNKPAEPLPETSLRPPRQSTTTNAADVSRKYPATALEADLATEDEFDAQFEEMESQIQFKPDAYAGTAGTAVQVPVNVEVTFSDGTHSVRSKVASVQVDITGGTAANKRLRVGDKVSPVDGSILLPLTDGAAQVIVEGDGAGTVLLGLSNPSKASLDVSDTATVTYS